MTGAHAPPASAADTVSVRLPQGRSVVGPATAKADIQYLHGEIFGQHCYERHGIRLADSRVVVDVGANVGLFALRVLELAPAATIYCFEPAPPTHACLVQNLAAHPRVEIFQAALGSGNEPLRIAYYPRTPGNSTLYPDAKPREAAQFAEHATLAQVWELSKLSCIGLALLYPLRRRLFHAAFSRVLRGEHSYPCTCMTLDQLFELRGLEQVDLLKVDVEGAERDVFEGLSDANLQRVRQLVVEISPAHKRWLEAFERRLRRAGFDNITLESLVADGEPRSDVFPCSMYATHAFAAARGSHVMEPR